MVLSTQFLWNVPPGGEMGPRKPRLLVDLIIYLGSGKKCLGVQGSMSFLDAKPTQVYGGSLSINQWNGKVKIGYTRKTNMDTK